jgi:hypothetical protein
MSRFRIILAAAGLAVFLISIATFSAAAETNGKDASSPQGSTSKESTAQLSGESRSISQGTVTGASRSELKAIRRKVAREERLPDYSQVVDNTSADRFDATGWDQGSTDGLAHGGSYASAGTTGTEDARFKLKVPTSGDYTLYAWWPTRRGNAAAARFGVNTAHGTKWTEVDQTRDGGFWVEIGTYEMNAGDGYVVRLLPDGGSGDVVADAVALVRGDLVTPPPADLAPVDGGPTDGVTDADSSENVYTTAHTKRERRALIRYGNRHRGTPYRLSPPAPCWAYRKEDCSCFTHLVYKHFGRKLPDRPVGQYRHHGRRIARSNLKRGDLIFFKERGYNNPITHVAMYSGNGYVLHASSYYNRVVNSKMKYIRGYFGAKRLKIP